MPNPTMINSNQNPAYYYERLESGGGLSLKSGFVLDNVDCSLTGTGKNTKEVCFDLTGKTSPVSGTYVSSNSFFSTANINNVGVTF